MSEFNSNHVVIYVLDEEKRPVADAVVTVYALVGHEYHQVAQCTTKGVANSHPEIDSPIEVSRLKVVVEKQGHRAEKTVDAACRSVTFEVSVPRHPPTNPLIVFVHGLGGLGWKTWGQLPDLVRSDQELREKFSLDCYEYPTGIIGIPIISYIPFITKKYVKIQHLANGLRTILDDVHPDKDDIALVCHSMGGLIARKYLVEEVKRGADLRVSKLALYAVPNNGADLASTAQFISWRHAQLKQLCKDSDMIEGINEDWANFDVASKLKLAFVLGGQDSVVDIASAQGTWGNRNVKTIPAAGHIDIVKPKNGADVRFRILKNLLLS